MQHKKSHRHLGRDSWERKSLFRQQVTDLLRHGKLVTTEAKAKEVRGITEKMITRGKAGQVHDRRQVLTFVTDTDVVKKLFDEVAPKYKERAGGYTRLTHLGARRGDNAEMVQLELV